jgi:hypothetical protein
MRLGIHRASSAVERNRRARSAPAQAREMRRTSAQSKTTCDRGSDIRDRLTARRAWCWREHLSRPAFRSSPCRSILPLFRGQGGTKSRIESSESAAPILARGRNRAEEQERMNRSSRSGRRGRLRIPKPASPVRRGRHVRQDAVQPMADYESDVRRRAA